MQPSHAAPPLPAPPWVRRVLALVYEAVLLTAVAFGATAALLGIAHLAGHGFPRWVAQAWLVGVAGAYFVPQWRAGQTLPMRTWRMRVANRAGGPITTRQAVLRYVLAVGSVVLCGAGFLWALADRDRQYLHDRLAGTRLVALPRDA